MASVAAFLLVLIKALPAAESLFSQLLAGYSAWKTEQNHADENSKNARNAALIAAALAARPPAPPDPLGSDGVRDLCAHCPARVRP